MRRTNPTTGLPFKHGDVREDGYRFLTYQKSVVRKDGTFKEVWIHPDKYEATLKGISKAGVKCQRARRTKQKVWVDEYKVSRGCERCGFDSHPAALDFDHMDRSLKSFEISQHIGLKSDDELVAEIQKCRILCANCHRIKSFEEGDYLR